ncbi:MAG: NAD(P)/FAD-dependent oxidoreductase [Deltaproteobacteria bacterium]|nr:NAD(P)/FAD-dependent oxidoreductase [Deltaproteobacteria bacterium]
MKDYDVIVIGSGMGGLSCAGILASRGLRVLVLEKNPNPGGYLTSFKRKGFIFDSAVDCFSGMDEKGAIKYLLKKLEVEDKIEFIKIDPIRESIFPGMRIKTWSDVDVYVESLKELFPTEKNIDGFFRKMEEIYNDINIWAAGILQDGDNKSTFPAVLIKYGSLTYKNLMDNYLYNEKLKSVLSDRCFFLGLPPSKISAISMAVLLMSYFISGAYRPVSGCQRLSDVLVHGIKKKGGSIFLKKEVTKIITENNKAIGVVTSDGTSYTAQHVVSNIDYMQTVSMLGDKYIFESQNILNEFEISPSFFILYVGAKIDLSFLGTSSSIGYFPSYDIEKAFDFTKSFTDNTPVGLTIPTIIDSSMSPQNSHSIAVHELTDYAYSKSWKEAKEKISERILRKVEKIIPNIKKQIIHIEAATPVTLERYTANFKGAAYGWQQLPWLRPIKSRIVNLYLAGHWDGLGGGVIAATYSGFKTAKEILKQSLYKI